MTNTTEFRPELEKARQRAIDSARDWAQSYNRPFSERTEAYSFFVDALDAALREASRKRSNGL